MMGTYPVTTREKALRVLAEHIRAAEWSKRCNTKIAYTRSFGWQTSDEQLDVLAEIKTLLERSDAEVCRLYNDEKFKIILEGKAYIAEFNYQGASLSKPQTL